MIVVFASTLIDDAFEWKETGAFVVSWMMVVGVAVDEDTGRVVPLTIFWVDISVVTSAEDDDRLSVALSVPAVDASAKKKHKMRLPNT